MTSFPLRFSLFLVALCCGVRSVQASPDDSVSITPRVTIMQGKIPFNASSPGGNKVTITIYSPGTLPSNLQGSITLVPTVVPPLGGQPVIPAGLTQAQALSYLTLDRTTLPFTGPAQPLTFTATLTVPAGANNAGSYGFYITIVGWPTTDPTTGLPLTVTNDYATINATVTPPPAYIQLPSPAAGAKYTIPGGSTTYTVPITVTGSTDVGVIQTASATLLNSVGTNYPLAAVTGLGANSFSWSTTADLPAGTYSLTAKDSNDAGGTATANTTFTVIQGQPPTATILSPANGSTINIPVGATTTNVSYSFEGSALLGLIKSATATLVDGTGHSIALNPTVASLLTMAINGGGNVTLGPGTYTLTATDDNGFGTGTATSTFVVGQSAAPTVTVPPIANVTIPVGATTAAVTYAFTGGTGAGTAFKTVTGASATLVDANGQPISISPTISALNQPTVTGTGSTTLSPGSYTFRATTSNGAVNSDGSAATATASASFQVLQASAPAIVISAPTATPAYVVPVGGTTAAVPISIAGNTSGGTAFTAVTSASATLTSGGNPVSGVTLPSFANIGSSNVSATGTANLPVGSYVLAATDGNGAPTTTAGTTATAKATVAFTVAQAAAPLATITAPANGNPIAIPSGSTTASVSYTFSGSTSNGTVFTNINSDTVTLTNSGGNAVPISPALTGLNSPSFGGSGIVTLPADTYTLSVTVSNSAPLSAGGTASSTATSTFTVVQTAAPNIQITSPADGSQVTIPSGATTAGVTFAITGGVSGGTAYNTITTASATLVNVATGASVPITPVFTGTGTSSVSGSGTVTLAAGKYKLTASDSNGAPTNGTATATSTFTVAAIAPPTVAITAPANGATIAVASGSTTAQVPYTITGATTYGTIQSASVLLNGVPATLQPMVIGLNSPAITATDTLTLAPGTYTLAATDSNGAASATAQVTFTVAVPAVKECLVWLNACSSSGTDGRSDGSWSWNNSSPSSSAKVPTTSLTVTGGAVVPIQFALHTVGASTSSSTSSSSGTTGDDSNNWSSLVAAFLAQYGSHEGSDDSSGSACSTCKGPFVKDTAAVIAIYEVYSNNTSSTPVIYTYSATGPNPPFYTIGKNSYLLNFPTAAGTHHYTAEVYQTLSGGALQMLGSEDIYSRNSCMPSSSNNGSSFTSTTIPAGATIWFNSSVNVTGLSSTAATLIFDTSTITFKASGKTVTLSAPSAVIKFQAGGTSATTIFNSITNTWVTTVPVGYKGCVFLTGLAYTVPAAITGGINPVTWTGAFRSDTGALNAQWQWGAAVYTKFSGLPSIGVKPCDDSKLSDYKNSDKAGSPESCKGNVTSGARGTGGTNYTGSYGSSISPSVGSNCWISFGCTRDDDGDDSGDHCGSSGYSGGDRGDN